MEYSIKSGEMLKISATKIVEQEISDLIAQGYTNNRKIFAKIKKNHPEIPRPSIRRIAHDYREKLKEKAEILKEDFEKL